MMWYSQLECELIHHATSNRPDDVMTDCHCVNVSLQGVSTHCCVSVSLHGVSTHRCVSVSLRVHVVSHHHENEIQKVGFVSVSYLLG